MEHPFARLRARLGFTQEEFASRIGSTQSNVSQIETGRIVSNRDTLSAFRLFRRDLKALGVTIEDVLTWGSGGDEGRAA